MKYVGELRLWWPSACHWLVVCGAMYDCWLVID